MASSNWTRLEDKMFEEDLAGVPEETQNRWEIIANHLQKSVAEVKEHYELLVHDLYAIDRGLVDVHIPDYKDDCDECESSKQGSRRSKHGETKRKQDSQGSLGSKHGETKRKRGDKWTIEEHKSFLKGLKTYGSGDWRAISRHSVKTRTSQQVASHAQKYFLHLRNENKKRTSIHDTTLDEDVTGTNMYMAGQNESPVQEQPLQ